MATVSEQSQQSIESLSKYRACTDTVDAFSHSIYTVWYYCICTISKCTSNMPAARSRDGASPIVRGMEREREIPEIFLQKMILINAVVLFMHQSVDLSIAL